MDRTITRDNFIHNVERLRTKLGYTQSEFAEMMDMSISGYRKMIAGETNTISLHAAYLVSDLTGVPIDNLMGIENNQVQSMEYYRNLSQRQRNFVDTVILFEKEMKEKKMDQDNYCTLVIPTGDMRDGMDYDSCGYEKINIGNYGKIYKDSLAFALKVTNNFFSPVYIENDILLIGNDRALRLGENGIFTCEGKVYLRCLADRNPVVLKPIVSLGKKIVISHDDLIKWNKIGYVLKKIRT